VWKPTSNFFGVFNGADQKCQTPAGQMLGSGGKMVNFQSGVTFSKLTQIQKQGCKGGAQSFRFATGGDIGISLVGK
jgi:hypothetical protein